MKKPIPCPQCNTPSAPKKNNSFWPFCCERCKLLDLGAWANEDYKIPTEDSGRIEENEE